MKRDSGDSNEAEMIRPADLSGFREKKEKSGAQAWDAWNKKWKQVPDFKKKDVELESVYVNIEVFVKLGFNHQPLPSASPTVDNITLLQ